MATLTSEVVRSAPAVHSLYEKKMTKIANLIVAGLADGSVEDRRARAWAMLGVLIGGINVARAMKGVKVTDEVSNAIKKAAIEAAGRTNSIATDLS